MKKLRIFIVEDESIILRSFSMIIESMGHELVGKATDGITAIEKINEIKPDLVLADINIPGKDGVTVVREACLDNMIPTIIITGHISDELVSRANCKCVFGYMMKPISGDELKAAINIAWGRYEAYLQENQKANDYKVKLEDRKVIERAKGILMDEFALKEAEAMKRLQRMAKDKRKPLAAAANELILAKEKLGI